MFTPTFPVPFGQQPVDQMPCGVITHFLLELDGSLVFISRQYHPKVTGGHGNGGRQ